MTFKNTILAGEELIRSAIRSKNFNESKEIGWRIARDGTATFQAINTNGYATGPTASYDQVVANDSLIYRGRELANIISGLSENLRNNPYLNNQFISWGIIAYADWGQGGNSATYPGDGTAYYPLSVDATFNPDRSYMISWYGNVKQLDTGYLQLHMSVGGDDTFLDISSQSASGQLSGHTFTRYFPGGLNGRQTISIGCKGGGGFQFIINTTTLESRLAVTDMGPAIGDSSYRSGNPPPPDQGGGGGGGHRHHKTWKTVEAACTGGWSYGYDGRVRNRDGGHLYQGQADSFWQNQFSYIWFQRAEYKELVGVPNEDIAFVEFYVYFIHWWNYDGGRADVGWHGLKQSDRDQYGPLTNRHGQIFEQVYTSRHQGRWMHLQPTNAIVNALQRGDFEGLQLGRAVPNNHNHYGYAAGDNELGHQPVMRMRYRK